jgi:predicted GNAT family acetyltransferase
MTTTDDFEFPDEAGYPDGTGTLTQDQVALIAEVSEAPDGSRPRASIDFDLVRDDEREVYDALVGDEAVATMTFALAKSRIALISAEVPPDRRNQGIATELVWRVLDDVRAHGETVTVICPIVRTFIDGHPEYDDLVNQVRPGLASHSEK